MDCRTHAKKVSLVILHNWRDQLVIMIDNDCGFCDTVTELAIVNAEIARRNDGHFIQDACMLLPNDPDYTATI